MIVWFCFFLSVVSADSVEFVSAPSDSSLSIPSSISSSIPSSSTSSAATSFPTKTLLTLAVGWCLPVTHWQPGDVSIQWHDNAKYLDCRNATTCTGTLVSCPVLCDSVMQQCQRTTKEASLYSRSAVPGAFDCVFDKLVDRCTPICTDGQKTTPCGALYINHAQSTSASPSQLSSKSTAPNADAQSEESESKRFHGSPYLAIGAVCGVGSVMAYSAAQAYQLGTAAHSIGASGVGTSIGTSTGNGPTDLAAQSREPTGAVDGSQTAPSSASRQVVPGAAAIAAGVAAAVLTREESTTSTDDFEDRVYETRVANDFSNTPLANRVYLNRISRGFSNQLGLPVAYSPNISNYSNSPFSSDWTPDSTESTPLQSPLRGTPTRRLATALEQNVSSSPKIFVRRAEAGAREDAVILIPKSE